MLPFQGRRMSLQSKYGRCSSFLCEFGSTRALVGHVPPFEGRVLLLALENRERVARAFEHAACEAQPAFVGLRAAGCESNGGAHPYLGV
jgi:hypothetical protein